MVIGFSQPMELKPLVDYYPNMRALDNGLLIFARFIGAAITPIVSGYLAVGAGIAAGFGLTTLQVAISLLKSFFTIYEKV